MQQGIILVAVKHILGFTIILLFLVAGDVLSCLSGHFMPGSVIGMILMFVALCLGLVKADWIRQSAEFLTKNMTIFFIPSAIGIMEEWGIIKANILPWSVIIVVGWLLVLFSAGWTEQLIAKLKRK